MSVYSCMLEYVCVSYIPSPHEESYTHNMLSGVVVSISLQKLSFSLSTDQVKFGEVVQAPPQLKSKPRGSKPTTASKPLLLLHQKMTASHKPTHTPPVVGLKRQKDLETERERVISVYRQIKKAALIRNSS